MASTASTAAPTAGATAGSTAAPAPRSPFRSDLLAGRVVLVSGGGTGINYAVAREFGAHGAKVALMGRRQKVIEESAKQLSAQAGCQAIGIQGDVRDFASCEKAVAEVVAKFGRLDVLVNGAAGNFLCAAEDLTPNGFKTVVDIDLVGTFNLSRAAFEALKTSAAGDEGAPMSVILNISATLHYTHTPYQAHAAAAKAGVDALTMHLAGEWAPHRIRVCGIAPGPIGDTEGMKRLGAGLDEVLKEKVPLRRYGLTREIGNAAVFLVSHETGGFITGETLVVDGGCWQKVERLIPPEVYQMIAASRTTKSKPRARL